MLKNKFIFQKLVKFNEEKDQALTIYYLITDHISSISHSLPCHLWTILKQIQDLSFNP